MATAGDSTKLTEHVRQVHFSLILACLAVLIAVSVATDSGSVDTALRDLSDVVRLHQSSGTWLRPYLERHLAALRPPLSSLPGYFPDVSRYTDSQRPQGLLIPLFVLAQRDGFWNYARHVEKGTYTDQELREAILDIASWVPLAKGFSLEINALYDFRVLWNVGEIDFYLPVALSAQTKSGEPVQLSYLPSREGTAYRALQHQHCQPGQYVTQESDNEASSQICVGSLVLTVGWRHSSFDLRDAINSYLGTIWRRSPFDQTFPELSGHSEGLDGLPLNGLQTFLKTEKHKSEQQIQVFGASIPTKALRLWGGLLIFSGQIYLYLHLRALRSRTRRDDPAWEVPWIGVYPDLLSRFTTIASGLFLPVAVTFSLASGQFPLQILVSWTIVGLSAACALGSGYELKRLWGGQAIC